MDVIVLIGRILFVLVFFGAGMGHLTQTAGMASYAEQMGVRPARPLVLLSGLWIIVGALLVLLGIWADLGALMLALFTLATALLMHPFWRVPDDQRMQEQNQFFKDLALAGAAIVLFGVFAAGDVGLVIVGPLFSIG